MFCFDEDKTMQVWHWFCSLILVGFSETVKLGELGLQLKKCSQKEFGVRCLYFIVWIWQNIPTMLYYSWSGNVCACMLVACIQYSLCLCINTALNVKHACSMFCFAGCHRNLQCRRTI